jgi:hypothetical protein
MDSDMKEQVKELALDGLYTDGSHHKQWYLEEIIKAIGFDLEEQRAYAMQQDCDWEPGTAP